MRECDAVIRLQQIWRAKLNAGTNKHRRYTPCRDFVSLEPSVRNKFLSVLRRCAAVMFILNHAQSTPFIYRSRNFYCNRRWCARTRRKSVYNRSQRLGLRIDSRPPRASLRALCSAHKPLHRRDRERRLARLLTYQDPHSRSLRALKRRRKARCIKLSFSKFFPYSK